MSDSLTVQGKPTKKTQRNGRKGGFDTRTSSPVVEQLEGRRYLTGDALQLEETFADGGAQLVVHGTNRADKICLSSRDGMLVIRNRTWSTTIDAIYDNILIHGRKGNDRIALAADFSTRGIVMGGLGHDTLIGGAGNDRLYGGAGSDQIKGGTGRDTLVSIGGGDNDRLTGGSGKDAFWLDGGSGEIITDASGTENADRTVHRIGHFFGKTSKELNGQNLADPLDADTTESFDARPLFSGAGPQLDDIQQGALGDCYFLAALGSIATIDPQIIRQSVVDLGDGTFAVRFYNNGKERYYRVDNDLPASWGNPRYAKLGADGSMWLAVMEKAFAFHRTGERTYESIEGGWMSEVYTDLGVASQTWDYDALYSTGYMVEVLQSALADDGAVTIGTIADYAGMVGGHAYAVTDVYFDAETGQYMVQLYNPWAQDGYSTSDGCDDGYICVSAREGWVNFAAVQVSFG